MNLLAFDVRYDEREYFEEFARKNDCEIKCIPDILSKDNLEMVNGYEAITILGHSILTAEILDELQRRGVKFCATRTVGCDHIDVKHARAIGLKICNADYPPTGVAEYTIMFILMAIRNYKQALWRGHVNDYSLSGLQGREIHDLTIGVIGTGRIGRTVIQILSGFGCKILAYDVYQDKNVEKIAEYVSLDTIYKECDVISLHTPLLESTHHMINREAVEKMKNDVVLVNCARGELMDVKSLIWGIESQKIGALALDVIEGEKGVYHLDRRNDIIQNKNMAYLRQFPNVIMTQHLAFYTDTAVASMVRCAVEGLCNFMRSQTCKTEI